MKKRKIGIVIDQITPEYVEAHYSEIKIGIEFDELGRLKLEYQELKTFFNFYPKDNTYEIMIGGTDIRAKQVGEELKKIGIVDPILIFNGERIKI